MHWLGTVTLVGIIFLAVLTWLFFRTRRQDMISEILAKRAPQSRLATRADYVQGNERMPVALTLTKDAIYYQNPDLEASFDLSAIDEVEYDDELATGKNVEEGCGALRLRAHGRAIEFVLVSPDCQKWRAALPPHRTGEPAINAV